MTIHNVYGLTESASPATITPLGRCGPVDQESGALSVGLVIPGLEAWIVNVEKPDEILPIGEAGELVLRGPCMVTGYWKKPDETAHAIKEDRLFTGDVAIIDKKGRYRLSGKYQLPHHSKGGTQMTRLTHTKRHSLLRRTGILFGLVAILALAAAPALAADPPKIKVGLVTFLSGGAAGPFGIPARNGSEMMIAAINAGKVPAPYNTKGVAGAMLETVLIDEAGNSQKQVTEYRKLIQKQNVDVVIGYISSGHCKAIAPVAEELGTLTIFFDCGTPQIFEDIVTKPKYLFRTGGTATMDSVAAARYMVEKNSGIKKIAGINQNYAWGQDSWRDFSESVKQLKPQIKVATEQFPKIYAGQYGAEISALLTSAPDVIHTSFWGGDMEAFTLQGSVRGVFKKSDVVLTTGETAMHRLGTQMPDGTVIGGRGPFGNFAPDSELNRWFREQYFNMYNTWPTYPSYKAATALLALKTAYDKAASGSALPGTDQVIAALENLKFEGPGGTVQMALANGHQAIMDTAYGRYKYNKSTGKATLTDVVKYDAGCVNPPNGVKGLDWIRSGFKGATCK